MITIKVNVDCVIERAKDLPDMGRLEKDRLIVDENIESYLRYLEVCLKALNYGVEIDREETNEIGEFCIDCEYCDDKALVERARSRLRNFVKPFWEWFNTDG